MHEAGLPLHRAVVTEEEETVVTWSSQWHACWATHRCTDQAVTEEEAGAGWALAGSALCWPS